MSNKACCIYLDNNANVIPTEDTLKELIRWSIKGNPSGIYPSAEDSKHLMDMFKNEIATQYGFSLDGPRGFTIIFTSGASESNSTILSITARAFIRVKRIQPHIITSVIEHDSILEWAKHAECDGIGVDLLNVGTTSSNFCKVLPAELRNVIRPNTCLVSVMGANNETGAINDIKTLASICHAKKIPLHSDLVQLAPRTSLNITDIGLDSFSISFHKMGGPIGCGLLAIRNSFLNGYCLPPYIYGKQQGNMRGGTIPIANIAASRTAFNQYYKNRDIKDLYIYSLKTKLMELMNRNFYTMYLSEFVELYRPRGSGMPPDMMPMAITGNVSSAMNDSKIKDPTIVYIKSANEDTLNNTLMFAIYSNDICNVKIRKQLMDEGIIVSIGSACKTGSNIASHILDAIKLPKILYSGVLRISLGDKNDDNDVAAFVKSLKRILMSRTCLKSID